MRLKIHKATVDAEVVLMIFEAIKTNENIVKLIPI